MAMRIEVTIEVTSDFHVGTGSGVGRTIDAVVLKDENGFPYIPASSLKGLARWHAEQLVKLHPQLDRVPSDDGTDSFVKGTDQLFGVAGADTGRVFFTNARYQDRTVPDSQVHGRSSRDRLSGRALEDHLFHMEDAPAGRFQAVVYSREDVSWQETLLLLMALRRIEALGGQRRRGKGRACIACRVVEGDPLVKDLVLPSRNQERFKTLLKSALSSGPEPAGKRPPAATPAESARSCRSATLQTMTGQVLLVFARARGPLTLTDDPETANIIGSLDFISGSSLRGALAWHLMHSGWKADQEPFQSAFVRDKVCFGPLYPSPPWSQEASLPFPIPRSLLTCKYYPGIWERGIPHARVHGVRDVLRDGSLETCGYCDTGSRCDAPLVPNVGYAQIVISGTGLGLRPGQIERLGLQRTEIDDEKLRGQDQRLYTTEAIPAGTWFAGYVWGPIDLLSALLQACPVSDDPLLLHVGKSRTRGHGELEVFLRLSNGNRHADYPLLLPPGHPAMVDPNAPDGFTLTFYSDTIGIDALLRPITRVDGETMWRLLGGAEPSPLKIERGYTTARQVAGFNSVPGVPRTPDWALVAGSTWHVQWRSGSLASERDKAVTLLQRAVSEGIGLRRGEGFGRIIVNLPLHRINFDQPRASNPQLAVNADLGLPDPLPPVPAILAPSRHRPSSPSLRGLLLDSIRRENRIGLARLLSHISICEDVPAEIEAALAERTRRGKESGGEEVLLKKLAEQCQSRDREAVQRLIHQCAVELSRLDAEERRRGR